jgi:cytidylate kinase
MIVAIDGPAASGKGTLAKRIAAHFGLHHLDTGLLYRAVARDVQRQGGALDDPVAASGAARALDPASLDDGGLRNPGAGEAASIVARIPEVRAALQEFQRIFAHRPPGAVLDGRDIGTAVCPEADVKIYVTATPEVRARRRHLEMQGRGEAATYEAVLAEIRRRDERDAGREASPMRAAADAFLLDTSNLDIEAAFDTAVGVILRKAGQRGRA